MNKNQQYLVKEIKKMEKEVEKYHDIDDIVHLEELKNDLSLEYFLRKEEDRIGF